jgi:hypothetical protein
MYICVTNVDSITCIPCTDAPMANGPAYPDLPRLVIEWWNQSEWPTNIPKYYGTCNDYADLSTSGVLAKLTKAEYVKAKRDEMYARKPFPSWVWDEDTLKWNAPVDQPWDGDKWDENTGQWIMTEQSKYLRIEYYKQKLVETDFKVLPDYDKNADEIKTQRQTWRDEIRKLEI